MPRKELKYTKKIDARVTITQKEVWEALGGADWLRKQLESYREDYLLGLIPSINIVEGRKCQK